MLSVCRGTRAGYAGGGDARWCDAVGVLRLCGRVALRVVTVVVSEVVAVWVLCGGVVLGVLREASVYRATAGAWC